MILGICKNKNTRLNIETSVNKHIRGTTQLAVTEYCHLRVKQPLCLDAAITGDIY